MLLRSKRLLLQPPCRLVVFKMGVKSCLLSVWPLVAWSGKGQFRSGVIVTIRAPTHKVRPNKQQQKKNRIKTTEGAVSHDAADLL